MSDISQAGGSEADRANNGGKLTTGQKEYVVRRLAAYDRPADIVKALRDEFGVKVTRRSVERYDPTRWAACPVRWKQLFFATRLATAADPPVQHRVVKPSRERERLLLHAVEALADRMLTHMSDKGHGIVAKPPEQVSDDDRLSALVTFIDALKTTDPAGYARLQAALKDSVQTSGGNDVR